MRKKRNLICLIALAFYLICIFVGQAWSSARDDVVAYARKVLN